ncbi:MAG: efflux RND transporter permease subunit [Planctomycetota bacterium]
MGQLEAAVEETKARLTTYPGVFDISDDSQPGKWEQQIKVKREAEAMGLTQADLAQTVRAHYYGEEVMRLQRGRHEVKLMVRYPESERKSFTNFDEIRIRTPQGDEIPLGELAQIDVRQGYTEINRLDQTRSITVTADLDESKANAREIVADLKSTFMPGLFEKYPLLRVRWEGQQEQTDESVNSLFFGFLVAVFAMYALLTMEFKSYLQPAIILVAIPFGLIGAIFGHLALGLNLTLFSLFGATALAGIVVNDSIVMVDTINQRRRDGFTLRQALLQAGPRRFRPILLTSITTIGGLLPIVLEPDVQAQILVPMAVAISFGLMWTTILVLIQAPVMYQTWARLFDRENAGDTSRLSNDLLEEAELLPAELVQY